MIERRRQIHDTTDRDLTVMHHHALDRFVDADDGHLGGVQDGRRNDAAQLAEAGESDGRAAELLAPRPTAAGGLGDAADLGGQVVEAAARDISHHRHFEAIRGLGGDAQVHGGMTQQHIACGVVLRIALRESGERIGERTGDERQIGQGLATRCFACGVQSDAQRFEVGDIDLFDIREMRRVALGLGHALGDDPAHTDDGDLGDAGRAALRTLEVGLDDASAGSGALHARQIEPYLRSTAAGRRRGHHARGEQRGFLGGRRRSRRGDGRRSRCSWRRPRRRGCARHARPLECALELEHGQFAAHGERVARLAAHGDDEATHRRGHLDHGLVGGHLDERRVLAHRIARCDLPRDDLGRDRALTEIGHTHHETRHAETCISASSARRTRRRPGKYSHSKACGYGVSHPATRWMGACRCQKQRSCSDAESSAP